MVNNKCGQRQALLSAYGVAKDSLQHPGGSSVSRNQGHKRVKPVDLPPVERSSSMVHLPYISSMDGVAKSMQSIKQGETLVNQDSHRVGCADASSTQLHRLPPLGSHPTCTSPKFATAICTFALSRAVHSHEPETSMCRGLQQSNLRDGEQTETTLAPGQFNLLQGDEGKDCTGVTTIQKSLVKQTKRRNSSNTRASAPELRAASLPSANVRLPSLLPSAANSPSNRRHSHSTGSLINASGANGSLSELRAMRRRIGESVQAARAAAGIGNELRAIYNRAVMPVGSAPQH